MNHLWKLYSDHVGRSILKSSELGFDRIDLLSLLLIHNSGLQNPERLCDGAHSRVAIHTLMKSQLNESFSQIWCCVYKQRGDHKHEVPSHLRSTTPCNKARPVNSEACAFTCMKQ